MDGGRDRAGTRLHACLRGCGFPPPTVNNLATLLDHAMRRPQSMEIVSGHARFTCEIVPDGRTLVPICNNWESRSSLSEELPRFDEAAIEWIQGDEESPSADKSRPCCGSLFPGKRNWFTDTMELMDWADEMFKAAFLPPNPDPPYNPETP